MPDAKRRKGGGRGQEEEAQAAKVLSAEVLGYPVTAPTIVPTAKLYSFIRELKALHERHRFDEDVTITLPRWRPALLRLEPPKESA